MLTPLRTRRHPVGQSPWWPNWLPDCEVAGEHEIPVIAGASECPLPTGLAPIRGRRSELVRSDVALHGYLQDSSLSPLLRDPGKYVRKAVDAWGVITPDFSMYRHMSRHHRVQSVWVSRAVGAYFEYRGLRVIPNVRWAHERDFDFICDGLPEQSTICVSTQSLTTNTVLRGVLCRGLELLSAAVRPKTLLIYGPCPEEVRRSLDHFEHVKFFDTTMRARIDGPRQRPS